ncbi:MAG TPA: zinc-dependent metalloprotease family protein [Lacibacter sp.]|nr:zinc-dependent metalloprotease family protein [Lacibacter sp.]HMP86997.1 zinc-dependent metalloprotease family protein [Lacibacter sp.]
MVVLQPLQRFDTSTLPALADSIAAFYPVTVQIAPLKTLPEHIYYKPRNRYRADRIIHWLRLNMADSLRVVVGLTSLDISSSRKGNYDYGIMGLGYNPGHACVVSSFRPAKTARNKSHLQQRVFKLVVHELGHNFGLPHCPDPACIMRDAEGKMTLDEESGLCEACKKKLKI